MPVYELNSHQVLVESGVWVAPTATVIGQVHLAQDASIWWGAVLRGDYDSIRVGKASNIQDNCVIHTDPGQPVCIGDKVTVGHGAVIHGCSIGDNTLIGINSTILNGAEVGQNCLIGSNTLVTEQQKIPDGSLVVGLPGRVVRELTTEEVTALTSSSARYVRNASEYRTNLTPQLMK